MSILFYSSFLFITNILSALIHEYYIYAFLFSILTMTSVMFYTMNNIYTKIVDKCAVLAIVLYGTWLVYNKLNLSMGNIIKTTIVVLFFLLCIMMYFYGFYNNKYCYDPNTYIADQYHCRLHIISSFAHHIIAFL
jgi:ABC-type multidrug transport system fused ATPase/permease subunit